MMECYLSINNYEYEYFSLKEKHIQNNSTLKKKLEDKKILKMDGGDKLHNNMNALNAKELYILKC